MAKQQLKKKTGIISKVAHGWDDIEAPIIAFAAGKLSFLMTGLHGNAKTTVAKLLGLTYGPDTFRYVDCAKANIISMAGMPDTKKMAQGEMAFVPTPRTLLGGDKYKVRVVLLDECTRAKTDTQNDLLEVMQEGTLYGQKIGYELLIGTANPNTYAGAQKMDAAFLDRFVACLPINAFKEVSSDDVESMIKINMAQEVDDKYLEKVASELKVVLDKVSKKNKELTENKDVQEKVAAYCAQMVAICKAKWGTNDENAPYISGREAASQLWRAIIALAAYYMAALNYDERIAFQSAAGDAIRYCWIVKHAIEGTYIGAIEGAHNASKFLLSATGTGDAARVQREYAKSFTPQSKLSFWENNLKDVIKYCDDAMRQEMMSGTMESIDEYVPTTQQQKANLEKDKLAMSARLYGIAKQNKEFASVSDSIEGQLVCQLVSGMNAMNATTQISPFKESLGKAKLSSSNLTDILLHMVENTTTKVTAKKPLF